ncbi:MAG: AAA family ATPase, partial [Bacteroidota bacterium]
MNPKPQIHTGTDSFAELLSENNVFVDKSMFIQEFLEESGGKVALITLPRRWGKTLNMDMLRRFLSLEVDELLKKVPTPTPAEKIQQWYNGYTFRSEVLYNPWS